MTATIIMGGQWGDEGKGKLTDALAARAQVVVRANGGSNAGHTVTTSQGIFKLHLMPSGILNPLCDCVIGAGVVIDPASLLREMDALLARGISVDRLWISERAHVVLPYHRLIDQHQEQSRGPDPIGTTLRGNGPAYADKVARHGIRIADLVDRPTLARKLRTQLEDKNRLLTAVYGAEPLDPDALVDEFAGYGERLRPHVRATEVLVQDTLDAGGNVLIECAQGAMLDVDYGSYPFVTSSSPTRVL
jgi:adenylosuccinate synthase